jgi:hypothetical protein
MESSPQKEIMSRAKESGTDQIGKLFIALPDGRRQCLVCDGVFTRQYASEHANVPC